MELNKMELEYLEEIKAKMEKFEYNQDKIKKALTKLNENLNIIFKDVRYLCQNARLGARRQYPP